MTTWVEYHQSELQEERALIKKFANAYNAKVTKLQENIDDGGADGQIEKNGKFFSVEARRKGYPNHRGKSCNFSAGWQTDFLKKGVFLNELTIKRYKDVGFIYLVEIKGSSPRHASITPERVTELLNQPLETMKSTNSGNPQSVKYVPIDWFKEF